MSQIEQSRFRMRMSVAAAMLALCATMPGLSYAQGLPQFRRQEPPAAPSPGAVVAPKSEASPLNPVTSDPAAVLPQPNASTSLPQPSSTSSLPQPRRGGGGLPQAQPQLDPSVYDPMLDPVKTLRGVENVEGETLYIRLGGRQEVAKIVYRFVELLAKDERINQRFEGVNTIRLQAMLADQICEATGGHCLYAGENMQKAHEGMKITPEEFNITGEHLVAALDSVYIPEKEKQELMTIVGSLANDIINR